MKNILILLSLFLLFGCAGYTNLENRIIRLEQLQDDSIPLTELAGADARWRDGRTGGSTDIDDITGMANGDWAFSIEESGAGSDFYPYIYDSTNCSPAADGTQRIDGSGGGCWYLVEFHVMSIVGEATDKLVNVAQSGDCYLDTDDWKWKCWDGNSWREVQLSEP